MWKEGKEKEEKEEEEEEGELYSNFRACSSYGANTRVT